MTSDFQTKRSTYLPTSLQELLPLHLCEVLAHCGAPCAEEIHLSAERIAYILCNGKRYPTRLVTSAEEIAGIFKRMCGGSIYAHRDTIRKGYLTLENGIRVGVCGHAATEGGTVIGVSDITGLVIRVPHQIDVAGTSILELLCTQKGGILLYAPPGVGKTTLLRNIARQAASQAYGMETVVVDTRGELGFGLDGAHLAVNILSGYPRGVGIEIAVQSLGAELIICDEIGDDADAAALLASSNRGVPILASAHAASLEELLLRPALYALHKARIFCAYVGLYRTSNNRFGYEITLYKDATARLAACTDENR